MGRSTRGSVHMHYMQRVGNLFGLRKSTDRRRRRRREAFRGMRVLVIDDSKTVVQVISRMMAQNDFEALGAGTAEEGLKIARESPPDLIFLDIILPGMNGFAALRKLRQDPATAKVPVIMISGDEHAMAHMVLERIGSDDFMKKPFGRGDVFGRIEKLVAQGRLAERGSAASVEPALT